MSEDLLKAALSVAVPLYIMQWRKAGLSVEQIVEVGRGLGQVIAEHGDNILYRSKKLGETASAFNALAKGVAALAFAPGGVSVFGLHFEAIP